LFRESLAHESSQAGAGDVDRGLVGGQAEVLVQIPDAEHLPRVLVEHGHDALVDGGGGGGGLRGGRCVVGRGEAVDDLAGGGELGQAGLGLGEGGGEPLDLFAQVVGSCGGLVVFGLQQP
jgi:hypothetical protein